MFEEKLFWFKDFCYKWNKAWLNWLNLSDIIYSFLLTSIDKLSELIKYNITKKKLYWKLIKKILTMIIK